MRAPLAPTLPPHKAEPLGPAATDAVTHFRSPTMPPGIPYALLPDLSPASKPWGFPCLAALARRIHRERGEDALQLEPRRVRFRDQVRDVTTVFAEDQVGGRRRLIGYAWIAGRDWQALEAALAAEAPAAQVGGDLEPVAA